MIGDPKIYEYGSLLASGYGIYQAKKYHETELEKSRKRHQEAIELAKDQHAKDLKTVKQTYLLELFNSLEQHFQQLNADLISSSRESERDMFDQRNQSFQTIILASSVMFSALSTVIVQGYLPTSAGEFLFITYSLTSALSFAFLFLCIVICIEIVMRASSFMYQRAQKHTEQLREAMDKTRNMMNKLGGVANGENGGTTSFPDRMHELNETHNQKSFESVNEFKASDNDLLNKNMRFRRVISKMNEEEIEGEWKKHESEIYTYLNEREKINEQALILIKTDDSNTGKKSFQQFWEESCKFWAELAILFFYAGSLNLLLSIMIFMWAEFFIAYESFISAVIAVSLIGLALVCGISVVIVLRINNNRDDHEHHNDHGHHRLNHINSFTDIEQTNKNSFSSDESNEQSRNNKTLFGYFKSFFKKQKQDDPRYPSETSDSNSSGLFI